MIRKNKSRPSLYVAEKSRGQIQCGVVFVTRLWGMYTVEVFIWWLWNLLKGKTLNVIRGKSYAKLHFKQGWTCKKHRNKARVKTCKTTTLLQSDGGKERPEEATLCTLYIQQMQGSLLVFLFRHHSVVRQSCCIISSLPCFCTFTGPSLLEMKFAKLFPLVSVVWWWG